MTQMFRLAAEGVKRGGRGGAEDERFVPGGERFVIVGAAPASPHFLGMRRKSARILLKAVTNRFEKSEMNLGPTTYGVSAAARRPLIDFLIGGLTAAGCKILSQPSEDTAPFVFTFEDPRVSVLELSRTHF